MLNCKQQTSEVNQKVEHIFSCAMEVLTDHGAQEFSMRKVSEKAHMSLSNVQYYFKTKELLLAGLLKAFLEDYSRALQDHKSLQVGSLDKLLKYILNDEAFDECGRVFKEIWAIAEQNASVKLTITQYYVELYAVFFDMIKSVAPKGCSDKKINNAVSVLLPFVEGYCITRSVLPLTSSALAKQLAGVIDAILSKD